MVRKKKVIRVANGKVEQIAQANNCSVAAVYNALSYVSDSEMAKKIRKEAIALYGGVTETKVIFE